MAKGAQENGLTKANKKTQFNSLKASGQDWFYHAPRTNVTEKPEKALPVSQIPGIGDLDHTPVDPHEDIHLRRKWIRETDSKYVKLAKEGGRKDLFIYREHRPSEKGAVHYPRVDWFDHQNGKIENKTDDMNNSPGTTYKSSFPEWYVHEEATCKQDSNTPSKNKRQIIAFDDMSCWKREAAEEEERRIKSTPLKFPSLVKNKRSKAKQVGDYNENATKFPDITSKPKEEANIGQLISMKYQRDWLNEQAERKQAKENTKVGNTLKERHKIEGTQNYSKRIPKDSSSPQNEEKTLFKLSRFANVPAKTDSHRT